MKLRLFLILVFSYISISVLADISGPTSSSTSSYTLSWTPPSFGTSQGVAEVGTGQSWNTSPFTVTRSNGTYTYEQGTCIVFPFGSTCVTIDTHTVVVNAAPPPQPESLHAQTMYDYEIRTGDFDSNGYDDILIERMTPSSGPDGSMQTTILEQNAGGLSTKIPSQQEINTARTYPINPNIDTMPSDMNHDGYADILLTGVEIINQVLTNDWVMYAPGTPGFAGPLGLTAMDSAFMSFFADYDSGLLDPNYYQDNVNVSIRPVFGVAFRCFADPQNVFFDFCFPIPILIGFEGNIGIGFNPEAFNVDNSIKAIINNEDLVEGPRWWALAQQLERVLGVYPFGYKADGTRGETNTEDLDVEEVEFSTYLEQFLWLRDPVGSLNIDPENWPRHAYSVENRICRASLNANCTVAQALCWLQKRPAPRTDGSSTVLDQQNITLVGGNPIRVHVMPPNIVVNETLAGHVLHDPLQVENCARMVPIPPRCSVVTNKIEFEGDELMIKTNGEGFNSPGLLFWANQIGGQAIFNYNSVRILHLINSGQICVAD